MHTFFMSVQYKQSEMSTKQMLKKKKMHNWFSIADQLDGSQPIIGLTDYQSQHSALLQLCK